MLVLIVAIVAVIIIGVIISVSFTFCVGVCVVLSMFGKLRVGLVRLVLWAVAR